MPDPIDPTAVDLANAIHKICQGYRIDVVYFAFGLVIGKIESEAEDPEISQLMRIIGNIAQKNIHTIKHGGE